MAENTKDHIDDMCTLTHYPRQTEAHLLSTASASQPINIGEHRDDDTASQPTNDAGFRSDQSQHSSTTTHVEAEQDLLFNAKDTEQRNRSRKCFDYTRHVFTDTWFPELLSWGFSLACFIAIVVILLRYDGKPLPRFPFSITISALVALFTTLSTTALMVPVSQGISQLKWLWFTDQGRRAADLDLFHQASSGVWGSLVILFSKPPNIASIGAILTILAVAANTITQQSINYPQMKVASNKGTATVLRSNFFGSYELGAYEIGNGWNFVVDQQTQAAVMDGILHGDSTVPFIQPHCSTGNCTWEPYLSLGVCSSFVDVSHLLEVVISEGISYGGSYSFTVDLPGVAFFKQLGDILTLTMQLRPTGKILNNSLEGLSGPAYAGEDVKTKAFQQFENTTVADFFLIWALGYLDPNSPRVWAFEVNLHFCVQNLSSTVTNGNAITTESGPSLTHFEYPKDTVVPPNHGKYSYAERSLNITATSPDSNEQFVIKRAAQQALLDFNQAQFYGKYSHEEMFNGPVGNAVGSALFPLLKRLGRSSSGAKLDTVHIPSFEKVLSSFTTNLARILSNRIREGGRNITAPAVGKAFHMVTHISITWEWIILLGVVEAGSLVFIVIVILMNRTHNNRLWRTSNMALLLALDPSARPSDMVGMESNLAMEDHAREATLRLDRKGEVWRLVA